MKNIFWAGYSNNERHSEIDKITHIIEKYGDIVDFKMFSDISLTIKIEIEELKIDILYKELKDNIRIDKFEYLNSISKNERNVYFNITFAKGTGNLIITSAPG